MVNEADINWCDRSEYMYKIEQHNGTSSYHTGSTTHICDFIINLHLLFFFLHISGNMCIISQVISSITFCISMWIMKLDGFNAPWVRYLFMRSIWVTNCAHHFFVNLLHKRQYQSSSSSQATNTADIQEFTFIISWHSANILQNAICILLFLPWPLLLTWINVNPSMDKHIHRL